MKWWLLLIFGLLLVSAVSAQTGGFSPYSANFGDSLNNILDFLIDNPGWIDALAVLVIFLVLGRSVFQEYFKSKALYITVAVALTIGVLLWERQSGISLILNSGPAGIVILAVAMLMGLFLLLKHVTGLGIVSFGIAYAIFYYYLVYLTNNTPATFPDWFYTITDYLVYDWGWLLTIILFVVVAIAVIHIFKIIFGGSPGNVRRGRDED